MGNASLDAPERVEVLARSAWGCPDGDASRWAPVAMTPTHVVLHHSAMWPNVGPECVRAIWQLHAIERTWGDVGYHYLVDADGVVYRGRAECGVEGRESVGAHVKLHNGSSLGICTLGTLSEAWPSDAALASLRRLVTALCERWAIDPRTTGPLGESHGPRLSGHRDWNASTECPGQHLYPMLEGLRNATALHLVRGRESA